MNKYDYEIVIIGGGPAGTTTAIYLADLGFDVCLIEKKIFPREVICGEFLSKEVSESLLQLNLLENFISIKPNKLKSFKFCNENGDNISSQFDFPAYAIKRSLFDNFLMEAAKNRGVKIFQPAQVKLISRSGNIYILTLGKEDASELIIKAEIVIAAYGKQNVMDKQLNRSFVRYKSKLNGIKLHVDKKFMKNFNLNEISIYSADGIYCGVNAVDDNTVTVCFLEDRNNYKKSFRQHLRDLLLLNRNFGNLFNEEFKFQIDNITAYGTGNIFFGKKSTVEDGIFMVGDAAGVIAPLAGDGIGMAMESARLLSEILSKKNKMSKIDCEAVYKKEWKRNFSRRIRTSKLIQYIILRDRFRNFNLLLLSKFPNVLTKIISATRN